MVTEPPQLHGHRKDPEHVTLDGTVFRVEAPVQRFLSSPFPQKLVIGDYTEESHPLVSTITWDDFTGGMLKERANLPEDQNRSFFTNLNVAHKGHMTRQAFQTRAVSFSTAVGKGVPKAIQRFTTGSSAFVGSVGSRLYGASDSGTFLLDTDTNLLVSFSAGDSLTQFWSGGAGDVTLLVASVTTGKNFSMSWDGNSAGATDSVWQTTTAGGIQYLESWNDMLWGVNSSAELHFSTASHNSSFAWTKVARVTGATKNEANGILVGPDGKLYVSTTKGLYRYDNEHERLDRVFDLPGYSPTAPSDQTTWQGSIYISQGMEIWKYTPLTDGTGLAENIGLTRDDGLPVNRQGNIAAIEAGSEKLYAMVRPVSSSIQYAGVYSWDQVGWNQQWTSSGIDSAGSSLGIQPSVGINMLIGQGVTGAPDYTIAPAIFTHLPGSANFDWHVQSIKHDWVLPNNTDSNYTFGFDPGQFSSTSTKPSSAELITPWVEARGTQTWNALSITVNHSFAKMQSSLTTGNASQTITDSSKVSVLYGTDYKDSFAVLGTIKGKTDSDGETIFNLGSGPDNNEGIPFEAFRLKVVMNDTEFVQQITPDIHRLSLNFRKNPDPLWGYRVVIDTSRGYQSRNPKQVQEDLVALFSKKTLMDFSYRNGRGETETIQVAPLSMESQEGTGLYNEGVYVLTLSEVQ